jgi:hypothetical protein
MRRRTHEVHPREEELLKSTREKKIMYPSLRRRTPVSTNEIEDVVRNLFYSLNMITHIQTNNLHPPNHICHEGLHVCTIPTPFPHKVAFLDM